VSDIQKRALNPQPTTISTLTWPTVTIPQAELPITIGGHPYLIDIDEFATDDKLTLTADGPRVGAGRIIDIADEKHPKVVSNIRLAVHQRANRPALANDPVGPIPTTSGYAGHYCAVPQRKDPGILACSMLTSGLRVFDIRNPLAPKEIAYFVAPVTDVKTPNAALSSATLVPARKEIWYADGSSGMYVLRVTNGAWGGTVAAPAVAPRPPAAPAAPRPAPGQLPATGLTRWLAIAALVLVAAAALARRTRSSRI
jgi:hypothetical protein